MMNSSFICKVLFLSIFCFAGISFAKEKNNQKFYPASSQAFLFTGRVDFTNPSLPRFYSPGVYVQGRFKGSSCEIEVNDEVLYGTSHNFITVVIDDGAPTRIKLSGKTNKIRIAENLSDKTHTFLLCKSTESGIGYIEFVGVRCDTLLPPPESKSRKVEFIGNSITCGMGADVSFPCNGTGAWYDQHNAYMSYGPLTARSLHADWVLSAVSGIGLIHSCCDMDIKMPQVFDKMNMRENTGTWDFSQYQPDVVTVCLGQNDGIQDSTAFCDAYIAFLKQLRTHYPRATILCLTSPMASRDLLAFLKTNLGAVINEMKTTGDDNVYSYAFSKRFYKGCGEHPDLSEHEEIAGELSKVIKRIKRW
ncbi:SGNH/GDSL hydrolase family protein [Arcticibacter pallidicorallinus]|nr:SGNH/GDSL hydrolase family protein [Arcticibacter pallidicorallinus]